MSTVYGYARVSTDDQDTGVQIEQLRAAGAENIVRETASGKVLQGRDKLSLLLDMLAEGDCLMVTKLDRLSRSTADTLNILASLRERGVRFVAQDIGIDTNTPTGQFAMTVIAAVAELERTRIRERQREGIEHAKRQGKYQGRQPAYEQHLEPVRQFLVMGQGATYIANTLGISRSTVYKIKRLLEDDGQMGIPFTEQGESHG